jgi:2-polyprenyl-3-methyl-5-hydroxy-6-metoxy-1,4-benzoquinol methylase
VITITLLEHVADNKAAVANIARALKPSGATHHYLPPKYHPYAIALRIVGPDVQKY